MALTPLGARYTTRIRVLTIKADVTTLGHGSEMAAAPGGLIFDFPSRTASRSFR